MSWCTASSRSRDSSLVWILRRAAGTSHDSSCHLHPRCDRLMTGGPVGGVLPPLALAAQATCCPAGPCFSSVGRRPGYSLRPTLFEARAHGEGKRAEYSGTGFAPPVNGLLLEPVLRPRIRLLPRPRRPAPRERISQMPQAPCRRCECGAQAHLTWTRRLRWPGLAGRPRHAQMAGPQERVRALAGKSDTTRCRPADQTDVGVDVADTH